MPDRIRRLVVLVILVVIVIALLKLVFTVIAVQQLRIGMLLCPDVPTNIAFPFFVIESREA